MQISHPIRWTVLAAASLLVVTLSLITYGESVSLTNPGALINTAGDDYSPSCTSDGKTIVFSSKSEVENSHKIFTCTNTGGAWSEPVPILEVCSDANDETPFISADGQVLLFSSDRPGGLSPSATADGNKRITFDIYISRKVNGQWNIPELLPGEVNTTMNERAPSLSPDGTTLFFTRFPYMNLTKSAIYMATYENGKYVNVRPLPESINSGNCEISFVPSGTSGRYYFASMRKGGFGGWDIYYTTLSEKGFSGPVNAGSGINSRYDDLFYVDTASLKMLTSNRPGGMGGYDLYASGIKKNKDSSTEKHSKKTGILLTVRDRANGCVIPEARVIIYRQQAENSKSGAGTEDVITCDKNGKALIITDPAEKWIMVNPAGEYYTDKILKIRIIRGKFVDVELLADKKSDSRVKEKERQKYTARDDKESKDYNTDKNRSLKITDLPELKPVYFSTGSAVIRTEYIPVIHGIIEYMRDNPDVNVIIKGHSDRRGSRKANWKLGRLRAQKIFQYMKSTGIPGKRMKIKSLGETDPQSTGNRYDNALNRRVEFEFTGPKEPEQ